MKPAYHLGCPIWANKAWVGSLYPTGTKAADFLERYAEVFSTVEGNSTFYALPTASSVERWRDQTPESFRFCFKLPRTVTHDAMLEGAHTELLRFFDRVAPLGPRLGRFMIQLPPSFGATRLKILETFLGRLPDHHQYVVEVRHPDFFDGKDRERALDDVLNTGGVGRCHFDTRAVFTAKAIDATTVMTQSRKPRVPLRTSVAAGQPFVRFLGQNDVRNTTGWLDRWADVVAAWIDAGQVPYVFMHAPDDFYAPRLARAFHYLLRKRLEDLAPHPVWPGEIDPNETRPQLGLF